LGNHALAAATANCRAETRTRTADPAVAESALAALTVRLKDKATNARTALKESMRLFKPDRGIGWHRAIVRRKWTFKQERKRGRPRMDRELEGWILQVARDNPTSGYDKLEGELRKLGCDAGATAIRTLLLRHGVPPTPERSRQGSSWRTFLNHYKDQSLARDFFTVETLTLQTLYGLFFIEHGTRQVSFAGGTAHPTGAWVPPQARQMTGEFEDRELPMKYLIRDHDPKFAHSFDTVFEAAGIEIVNIPYQAPNANAVAERWVRSVREECLDRWMFLNEGHLRRVLTEYVAYFNERRAHQALDQGSPLGLESVPSEGPIRWRNVLGGIIRDDYREAA
jgi:putative transposase